MKKSYTTPVLTIVGFGELCQSIGFNAAGSTAKMYSKQTDTDFDDEEDDSWE